MCKTKKIRLKQIVNKLALMFREVRGLFRIQSNICDGEFLQKQSTAFSYVGDGAYFSKILNGSKPVKDILEDPE